MGEEAGPGADAAPNWRSTATGGLMMWGGTVALGLSTVVLLAVLARHQGLVGVAGLLALSFVLSLIPAGLMLRAAALFVDGHRLPKVSGRLLVIFALGGVAASPLLGLVFHLPVLAVDLLVIQVLAAIQLAISRGAILGAHRFTVLGVNMILESVARVVLGVLGGLALGITGLAGGLALSTALVLLVLKVRRQNLVVEQRPMTSLLDTSLTLGLLGLFAQIDILMAPTGLTKMAAAQYDLAAVPSKGVYLMLLAAGPFVFPFVRRHGQRRLIALAALATLAAGLAVTAVLLPLRGLIGTILGQGEPGLLLLLLLGAAMACAGTTAVIINAEVARGVQRPWPPLLLGIGAVVAVWASRPTALSFAVAVLAAQAGIMLLSLWICLRYGRALRPPPVQI